MFTFQRAKHRGAKIVQDIWEESDENGTVRFARVQTVSICANQIILVLEYSRTFQSQAHEPLLNYEQHFKQKQSHFHIIFRIQKKAIRIMEGSGYRVSCRDLFKKFQILPLTSQYILSLLMFVVQNKNFF
jgi:hypothetical protein